MAKTSAVQKNKKRARMAEKYAGKRAQLKEILMDKDRSPEERFEASLKMAELPRNSSKVRVRNRCERTGRPRGTYRKFKLGRVALRDLAASGQIPGMVKSSW